MIEDIVGTHKKRATRGFTLLENRLQDWKLGAKGFSGVGLKEDRVGSLRLLLVFIKINKTLLSTS